MKVTVHAEGTSKEIHKQLTEHAAIYGGANATSNSVAPKSGKRTKAPEETEEFATDDDAEESEENEEAEESEESDDAEETPEHEDVVKAFQKYQKKYGEEKALAKLKKLGFKSVKQIKPEQRANVIASVSM